MTKTTEGQEVSTQEVAFEVYGIHARVSVPAGLVPRVVDQLPLHATRCEPQPGGRRFALDRAEAGGYEVLDEGVVQARTPVLDNALAFLRYRLFDYAVHHARDHLIVSAGVVGCEGRAIVLPGPTRVGKTMLVAALLRAGAVYYADDWAILDARGQVHPYPTPLFRLGGGKVTAESLGAVRGASSIPVGLIALTSFAEGGRWNPRRRTPAQGVMMLVGNAYGMDDPPTAMKIAHAAAEHALVIEGERGEADEAAKELLDITAQAPSGGPP